VSENDTKVQFQKLERNDSRVNLNASAEVESQMFCSNRFYIIGAATMKAHFLKFVETDRQK